MQAGGLAFLGPKGAEMLVYYNTRGFMTFFCIYVGASHHRTLPFLLITRYAPFGRLKDCRQFTKYDLL